MKPGSKVIGLTVGQKSFLLAEVAPKGGRNTVQHFAEFVFPEGLSLSTPEKLGEALAQFLRGRKFSTRDVVIGLPAKRLLTRRKEVPAASLVVAASTLRLQAEGEFSSELDNLVMDFAGMPSAVEATTVLLIATNREVIDQCQKIAHAAGLRVQAITATTAALGRATSRLPGGDGWVLNLGQAGAEVVVQHGQDPAHLRHLNAVYSSTPEAISALAGEIRRMMASIPRNGTPMTLALWNGPTDDPEANPGSLLEQRLSMPVTMPELEKIVATENSEANGYAPAVAVALAALEPAGLPVDFLHSRLEPPKDTSHRRATIIGICVGVLLLGLIAWAGLDLYSIESKLDSITAARHKISDQVKTANAENNRNKIVQRWTPPPRIFVSCLRDVTSLFPAGPETVWATSLSNNKDASTWTLNGIASSQAQLQGLRDAFSQHSDRFEKVQVQNATEDAQGLINFVILFQYNNEE